MFQRFHAMREQREGGFTLIELLVVILIIAILAAIAIPVFLNQRRKGWEAQAEATLKNAATAEESYATGPGNGTYTDVEANLTTEGFRYSAADIAFDADVNAAGTRYCLEADSQHDGNIDFRYDSSVGAPVPGECPAL
jgi:type IV pilus assembly protein PilA